jgi:hypothetical protein
MVNTGRLKVALIADELTTACLRYDCEVVPLTPILNYWTVLRFWRPDLLFVESAWQGNRGAWKYKIASYPDHPQRTNKALARVVSCARELGIPTVFWNKEDGVHFNRFIDSARLFDHVFTVDENCVPRYRAAVGPGVTVDTLSFPVQPRVHFFDGFRFRYNRANFVGSYSHHIHERRREWQNMFFDAATRSNLGLTVFDRNSDRKSSNYRYPELPGVEIRASVPHEATAQVYKDYLVSLNVNTIENSATMYSRRLVEILACGGIAVTNPTPAVERYFAPYCHIVSDAQQGLELFNRLKHGPSREDLERAEAGAIYIQKNHTWAQRLRQVMDVVGARK